MSNDGTRIDYEELLIKYMAHVIDNEGIPFLNGGPTVPSLSPEERLILEEVEEKARKRYNL